MILALALLIAGSGEKAHLSTTPDPAILTAYWEARELASDAGSRICALDGDRSRFRPWFDRLNAIGARLVRQWGDSVVAAARPPSTPRPPMMLCEDKGKAAQAVKSFQASVDALERNTGS